MWMTHSIAHFTPPYIIYNCLVKHRKQRVCLHLVAQDSHGSAVLIMMADNTMEPLRFGIRSEHLYPEALHTAMSCITHITTVKHKKKEEKKKNLFSPVPDCKKYAEFGYFACQNTKSSESGHMWVVLHLCRSVNGARLLSQNHLHMSHQKNHHKKNKQTWGYNQNHMPSY